MMRSTRFSLYSITMNSMRNREEIKGQLKEAMDTGYNGGSSSWELSKNQSLILEVLLDIRDLLSGNTILVKEETA